MTNTVQVVCNDTGESSYVKAKYCPQADFHRATCANGCMCGAAEYREEL